MKLHEYEGKFLPHEIADYFATQKDVSMWLASIGETVETFGDTGRVSYARTASNYRVCFNGYVSKVKETRK